MLTEMQKANINNLNTETCLEIMHECAERLGVVSVDEYQAIVGIPRRTIYAKMLAGAIKHFTISNHKFPIIN